MDSPTISLSQSEYRSWQTLEAIEQEHKNACMVHPKSQLRGCVCEPLSRLVAVVESGHVLESLRPVVSFPKCRVSRRNPFLRFRTHPQLCTETSFHAITARPDAMSPNI